MGNTDATDADVERQGESDQSGESKLRGDALAGPEQKRAVDHTTAKEAQSRHRVARR